MSDGLISIAFDVAGERQIARMFQLTEEWTHDLSEPLGELMDDLLDSVSAQFDTEGAAAHGQRWQPLSGEYALWKHEHYPGQPILQASGEMRGAMLNKQTAVHVGPEEAVYEPVSRIAGFHQAGADWIGPAWGRGEYPHHLPRRRMVELSETWKHEHVDRTFARWISRRLAEDRLVAAA